MDIKTGVYIFSTSLVLLTILIHLPFVNSLLLKKKKNNKKDELYSYFTLTIITIFLFLVFEVKFFLISSYLLVRLTGKKGLITIIILSGLNFSMALFKSLEATLISLTTFIDQSLEVIIFSFTTIIEKITKKEVKINRYIQNFILALFYAPLIIIEHLINENYLYLLFSFVLVLTILNLMEFYKVKMQSSINKNKKIHKYKSLDSYKELGQKLIKDFNLKQTYNELIKIGCEQLSIDKGVLLLVEDDCFKIGAKRGLKIKEKNISRLGFLEENLETKNLSLKFNKSHIDKLKLNNFPVSNFLVKNNYKSALMIKVYKKNKIDAIMIYFSNNENKFSEKDIIFCEGLGGHAPLMFTKAKIFEELEENNKNLEKLQKAGKDLNSTIKIKKTLEIAGEVINEFTNKDFFLFFLRNLDEDNKDLRIQYRLNFNYLDNQKVYNLIKEKVNECVKCEKIIIQKEMFEFESIKNLIFIPIKVQQQVLGVIVSSEPKMKFKTMNIDFFNTLSNQIATAVENALIYQKMEEKAIKDGLTQLYNHSYFQEVLTKEINRTLREERNLSILLLDIDNFKNFNDTYGHQAGDEVLRSLARVLEQNAREYDTVARYGGEEFVIVLPNADEEKVLKIGKRFNKSIREMVVKYDGLELKITASIGASTYKTGLTKEKFIEIADKGLYKAKEKGKDQTCWINP